MAFFLLRPLPGVPLGPTLCPPHFAKLPLGHSLSSMNLLSAAPDRDSTLEVRSMAVRLDLPFQCANKWSSLHWPWDGEGAQI